MKRTYLHQCHREGRLIRWPDGAMPINVYLAPFTWYEKKKQQESLTYRQMVMDSLDAWRKATSGKVRFNIVDKLNMSQIDFKWRRVDRKSLGHCRFEVDNQSRLFSAEIQIGISDGLLHARYQDAGEVQHTIIHEIGHALGLDHSDGSQDIMYVPHQYGIHQLSPRDIETIEWLYSLPVGFHYESVGTKYNLKPGFDINDVIHKIEKRIKGIEEDDPQSPETTPPPAKIEPQRPSVIHSTSSLEEQHHILSQMGRFYLKTQNIQVDKSKQDALRRIMMEQKLQNQFPPPEP